MNDKQQLAAMGEHLAEQQPMCMAKRIEELEEQVRVMGGALNELREFAASNVWDDYERGALLAIIDAALVGKLPTPVAPEGWQLVPVEPTFAMLTADGCKEHHEGQECTFHKNRRRIWAAMLSAAPKPEVK